MLTTTNYIMNALELQMSTMTDGVEYAKVCSMTLTAEQRLDIRFRGYITAHDGTILSLCCLLS